MMAIFLSLIGVFGGIVITGASFVIMMTMMGIKARDLGVDLAGSTAEVTKHRRGRGKAEFAAQRLKDDNDKLRNVLLDSKDVEVTALLRTCARIPTAEHRSVIAAPRTFLRSLLFVALRSDLHHFVVVQDRKILRTNLAAHFG